MKLPRLKELRLENGITQRRVAEELGLKQQTYSRYELGQLEPNLEVMAKLSKLYGVSVDYIIGVTDER